MMAAHRQHRAFRPAEENCPFCPSGRGRQAEISAASYTVASSESLSTLADPERADIRHPLVAAGLKTL